jgi:CDP-paratose 2-epimerase
VRWLVTGGAGFIGTNLVDHLRTIGDEVVVVDDLSRDGVESNKSFLAQKWDQEVLVIDVADYSTLVNVFIDQGPFDAVAHLAGQVSLMASIENPRRDFAVNAEGTLNVLEAVRHHSPGALVIGMSSNKVYGDLSGVEILEDATRFIAPAYPAGFDESLPLDFHGPYGCSKGAADQYLLDYHRIYGLRTVSLRQSSVFGRFQHPRSDQGWVGFLIDEARQGRQIQLHGVGKQVRDLLYATDLAELFSLMAKSPEAVAGQAFNVGGGPTRALSILELFEWLKKNVGVVVDYLPGDIRPSDQKIFVADIAAITKATGWQPNVSLDEGLNKVYSFA